MKISIEFTVEPDEIPMATELLTVLQRITAHIRPSNGPRLFEQLFKQVIHSRSRLEETGQRIRQILSAITAPEEAAAVRGDLFQAFQDVALVPDVLIHEGALTSLMDTLPVIGEPYVGELLHKLVPHLLTKLSKPRAAAADRVEFFAEAEAFAHVVRLDFIAVSAAVKAVTAMVKGAGTRAAAMTILGKLTELCSDKVRDNCDQVLLRDLQTALAVVTEESLQYDVAYVSEHLLSSPVASYTSMVTAAASSSASSARPAAAAAAAAVGSGSLEPAGQGRLRGLHQRAGFTLSTGDAPMVLAVDQQRDVVHVATNKGSIASWNLAGSEVGLTPLPENCTCSAIDVHMRDGLLVLAAKNARNEGSPSVLFYDLTTSALGGGTRQLPLKLTWTRPESKIISCVNSFNRPGQILEAEAPAKGKTNRINLVDLSGRSQKDISVVSTWEEHEWGSPGAQSLISSLAAVPDASQLFLSSSLDGTVRVWDVRRPGASVGVLGRAAKGTADLGHTGQVLSVDASATYAVSCDYKSTLLVWDMRKMRGALGTMQSAPLGPTKPIGSVSQGALKVSISPDGETAGVVVASGLRLLRLSTCQVVDVPISTHRTEPMYVDLRWHIASHRLLVASQTGTIDIFDGDVE